MKDLLESRKEIDEIDDSIIRLFEKRMEVCKNVAEYKLRTDRKSTRLNSSHDV